MHIYGRKNYQRHYSAEPDQEGTEIQTWHISMRAHGHHIPEKTIQRSVLSPLESSTIEPPMMLYHSSYKAKYEETAL